MTLEFANPRKCKHCDGTGNVPPRNTGRQLIKERERIGASMRLVAALMRLSPTYLCDLEHDRRDWTWERVSAYRWALGRASEILEMEVPT